MKQILHILAKDARHFWPEIFISLALVGALVWIYPSTWQSRFGLYAVAGGAFLPTLLEARFLGTILPLLVSVSWWLLIGRVVHAEALVGHCQFWVTRPYEWKKLLGAKALFLLAFLYLPLLVAQCLLLSRAGFHPLSFVPGLLFDLLLITGIIVLPLLAITTVIGTFARVTVTLLALLICFIGYIAISLHFSDSASLPFSNLSIPLALCFCGTVVVLQYATRRVWVSRLFLIALPLLLVLSGLAVSDSTTIRRDYPRASGGQEAPVQLALRRDAPHLATAYLIRAKEVQVTIPLQVSGVAEGYVVIPNYVKTTIDAANGSHWTSPWQAAYNWRYLPGENESWIMFQMSRVFFDDVRSTPVTLHFTMAITQAQASNVRRIPLPARDFSVADFGICSPETDWFSRQFFGIDCRFALRQPKLTYISVRWTDGPCPASQPGPNTGIEGDAWVGTLEQSPADFGISPVWNPSTALSNATKIEGNKPEQRHLCPGTPLTFTQFNMVGRTQYDFTIPDFRFPSYHLEQGSPTGGADFTFTTE
jgi:hypothetical protein